MFDVSPSEEHLSVARMCRSIAVDVIAPAARQAETERAVPPAVWKALLETGLTMPVAEEFGGEGVPDTVTQMIAVENLAYGDPGITMAAVWNGAVAFALGQHGGQTHRQLLTRLISNPDLRAGLALYEGFGRGASEWAATIGVSGDEVAVRGRKVGVPFAGAASVFLVLGLDPATGDLRLATVPASTAGVSVTTGPGALALEAVGAGTVDFDVRVPRANLVGGPGADSLAIATTAARLRLLVAAAQLGAAQRAVEYASKYATERIAFGRPIAAFQGVSFPLAESQMQLAQLRLEISDVASRLDVEVFADLSRAVTAVVNYAGEVASEASRTALQTLGGHGFIKDHPVELWYRSCAALSVLDFDPLASAFVAAL
jgi:alkylation response protein AidB-like acyl-CoA dehydrogenase